MSMHTGDSMWAPVGVRLSVGRSHRAFPWQVSSRRWFIYMEKAADAPTPGGRFPAGPGRGPPSVPRYQRMSILIAKRRSDVESNVLKGRLKCR